MNLYEQNKKDIELYNFFVINCPVRKKNKEYVSEKGRKLNVYLDYSKSDYLKLISAIKRDLNNNVRWCNCSEEVEGAEKDFKSQNGYKDDKFEYIAILDKNDHNKVNYILYMIRNSLAHADFEIDGNIYRFRSEFDQKCKAMIRLKYKTVMRIKERYLNKDFS